MGDIIQSNLVNWKSSGLEVLFRIITSLNYKEVDKNMKNPNMIFISFFPIKHKFWARKRNVSKRRSFYAPKTYVIIDRY